MDEPLKGSRDHREAAENEKKYSLKKYFRDGHVHGIKYLGRRDKPETFFWVISLLIAIFLTAFFIYVSFELKSDDLITAQHPSMPIHFLPFPAVTICPETKSQKKLLDFTEAYHAYHLDQSNKTFNDEETSQIEALSHVCDPHLFETVHISSNPTPGEQFRDILRKVAVPRDFILFCKFQGVILDCADLFKETIIDDGICYTFNMLENSDMFKVDDKPPSWWVGTGYYWSDKFDVYPRRALGGADMGLNVVLNSKTSDLDFVCKGPVQGYKVKLHRPDEFPRMATGYNRVALNIETLVGVTPEVAYFHPQMGSARSACHTTKTKSLNYFEEYSQANCITECLSEFVLERCECVKFSMVHGKDTKICTQHKTECISNAALFFSTNYTFEEEFPCDCKPSCSSLSYDLTVSQAEFNFKRVFKSFDADLEEFPEAVMSRLTIYMEENFYAPTYQTEKDSPLDIIAQIGGITAFFLGASALSVVEIFYYLFRRFMC